MGSARRPRPPDRTAPAPAPPRSGREDPGQAPGLTYDVVLATRNRPAAVALSLPLLLKQTRPAAQILVVDSSDDPAPIRTLAQAAAAVAPMPVIYLRAAAGLTHQRNVGLARCSADVVIFPDDDSLLYPDAAAEIMAIYERDTGRVIAGVAARPVDHAPPETDGDLGAYAAEEVGAPRAALRRVRQTVKEALGFANPFVATGRALSAQHRAPDWLAAADATVVPYMTGFRMSFRRRVIAATGFDETLRRYGWFEDIDASYSALRRGLLVTAGKARLHHHRVASGRAAGHRMGLWAILNRTYVVMKHVRANPQVFRHPGREIVRLGVYCRLRTLAYRTMARDGYGRERAQGAREGVISMSALTGAAPEALIETYRRLDA